MAFAACCTASSSTAQTAGQLDRLNTLAKYSATLQFCDSLGMTVVPDAIEKVEVAAGVEAVSGGMTLKAYKEVSQAAVDRQLRILDIDLDVAAEKATKDEVGLRKLRLVFVQYGTTCMKAAVDPLFSRFLSMPPGFDLNRAANEAADVLLKDGGYASWQTPAIQARGDLMTAAGTCRNHIGSARSDAIFGTYSRASNARERAYYVRQFDAGLSSKAFNFDTKQCERLIRRLSLKAQAK